MAQTRRSVLKQCVRYKKYSMVKRFILLFADDDVMLAGYCITWRLKINIEKANILVFVKGRHSTHNSMLNEKGVRSFSSCNYFGTYLRPVRAIKQTLLV